MIDKIKRYFFSGLATVLPLFITVYITIWIFRFFDRLAGNYVNAFLLERFGFTIPGLGLLVTILAVVIIGVISGLLIAKRWAGFLEKIFLKIPFIASIYPSAKQLSDFLFREDKKGTFKKVVLVEYPCPGSYSIGFLTNEKLGHLSPEIKDELLSVFVPLPPSPFSGLTLLVPKNKIVHLDIPVERAIKFIVSCGVVPLSDAPR